MREHQKTKAGNTKALKQIEDEIRSLSAKLSEGLAFDDNGVPVFANEEDEQDSLAEWRANMSWELGAFAGRLRKLRLQK